MLLGGLCAALPPIPRAAADGAVGSGKGRLLLFAVSRQHCTPRLLRAALPMPTARSAPPRHVAALSALVAGCAEADTLRDAAERVAAAAARAR
eukprot:gene21457-50235_t